MSNMLAISRPLGAHKAFTAGSPQRSLCEYAARVCYHSDDKMGHAPEFLDKRAEEGHLDVFEHVHAVFSIPASIGAAIGLAKLHGTSIQHLPTQGSIIATLNARHVFYSKIQSILGAEALDAFFAAWDKTSDEELTWPCPRDGNVVMLAKCSEYGWPGAGGASFEITGVSRAFSHQIVRHRLLSFSQESQRYVQRGHEFVTPPSILENELAHSYFLDGIVSAISAYDYVRSVQQDGGRKMAKEDARFLLPNAMTTRMVVSGPMEAWDHFLSQRLDGAAQWEIRDVANSIRKLLYGDMEARS